MSTWRYVQNGQPSAPLDTTALQTLLSNGTLSPDTYVWREGMTNWLAAKSVPELAASCSTMPPLPGAPPPITVSAADDIDRRKRLRLVVREQRLRFVERIEHRLDHAIVNERTQPCDFIRRQPGAVRFRCVVSSAALNALDAVETALPGDVGCFRGPRRNRARPRDHQLKVSGFG